MNTNDASEAETVPNAYSSYKIARSNSDFVIGIDDFASLEIREGGKENGFHYFFDTKKNRLITRFVLETSVTGIKTVCLVAFIFSEGKYLPRIEVAKRTNTDALLKEEIIITEATKTISARVGFTKLGSENFWKLVDYIQGLKNVDVPRDSWTAVPNLDNDLIDKVAANAPFVSKILEQYADPESQQKFESVDQEVLSNIYASSKQIKNKKALNELSELLKTNASEAKLEKWIKDNDWVFGIEYVKKLDATKIGLHSDADLLIESLDGFADLIELKKSSAHPLFIEDGSHPGVWYPSAILSQVLGQTIFYLHSMNELRHILQSTDKVNVLKPRAKIVIGRSSKLSEDERHTLRRLNDTLHGIEILTYDEIELRAKTIVSVYEKKDD